MEERRIEVPGLLFLHPDGHDDAARTEPLDAASRRRIGVARRDDDARDTARAHGVHARRLLPRVRAGLERHVERRSARPFARLAERDTLGMLAAELRMVA